MFPGSAKRDEEYEKNWMQEKIKNDKQMEKEEQEKLSFFKEQWGVIKNEMWKRSQITLAF